MRLCIILLIYFTNWNLLIQNFSYRIIKVFCNQSNLFSIRLVKDYSIVHFNHQVNEEVYSPAYPAYDCEPVVQPVTYDAFYFPNYFSPPSYLRDSYDEEVQARLEDWRIDVMTGSGNIDHNNIEINNFLRRYIDAFEKYDTNVYTKEDFEFLIDAYFRILNKKEKPDK